jgi:hypothetical protein
MRIKMIECRSLTSPKDDHALGKRNRVRHENISLPLSALVPDGACYGTNAAELARGK